MIFSCCGHWQLSAHWGYLPHLSWSCQSFRFQVFRLQSQRWEKQTQSKCHERADSGHKSPWEGPGNQPARASIRVQAMSCQPMSFPLPSSRHGPMLNKRGAEGRVGLAPGLASLLYQGSWVYAMLSSAQWTKGAVRYSFLFLLLFCHFLFSPYSSSLVKHRGCMIWNQTKLELNPGSFTSPVFQKEKRNKAFDSSKPLFLLH